MYMPRSAVTVKRRTFIGVSQLASMRPVTPFPKRSEAQSRSSARCHCRAASAYTRTGTDFGDEAEHVKVVSGDIEGDAGHPRAVRDAPRRRAVHVVDRARATLLELVLEGLHRRIEALDVPDRQQGVRAGRQLGQLLRGRDVQRERLLGEDGDARLEKVRDDIGDDPEGNRDDRDVERFTSKRLVEPGVRSTNPDCRTSASTSNRVGVDDHRALDLVASQQGPHVQGPHGSAADNKRAEQA